MTKENEIEYISYKEKDIITDSKAKNRSKTGYGSKIVTSKMLKVGKKKHRIYCMVYGNSGSCYIVKGKKKVFLHDYPDE